MADLLTLEQFKAAMGDDDPTVSSSKDAEYELAIAAASELIRSYTGRTFEVAAPGATATQRIFEYDGSGYLDIDECMGITGLTTQSGYSNSSVYPLTTDDWNAYPLNKPVKMWLTLSNTMFGGMSPEMGFTWNLDLYGYRFPTKPNVITVTAVWGWDALPADVVQAAIWTASEIADPPSEYQSESIENYSRTRAIGSNDEAIPSRAIEALLPYIVPRV